MTSPAETLTEMAAQLADSGMNAGLFAGLGDAELIAAQKAAGAVRRELERCTALAAAEIARRSRPELGRDGLSRRQGFIDSTLMVQSISGSSKREVRTLVRVGEMMAETDAADEAAGLEPAGVPDGGVGPMVETPWFAALAEAVADGRIGVGAADAISRGLGEPNSRVSGGALAQALGELLRDLCADGRLVNADDAMKAARVKRDEVDAAGVAEREAEQRARQYWRMWMKDDGMIHGEFELDAENGALMKAAYDQLTHPRRKGDPKKRPFGAVPTSPRDAFVERAVREREAAEGLVQLVRAGASVDPTRLLDTELPSVRLVVNERNLGSGEGFGAIEGHPGATSLATIERGLCAGYLPVLFNDSGQPMNLGRDERLFTKKQKIALAIRDGGCREPDCDRPPSWTEAHHIEHWKRDHGKTDIDDGILLCRRGHLRVHNEGWDIRRDGTQYWLIPPASIDPARTPRLMRPKARTQITNPVELPPASAPPAVERSA